MPSPLGHALGGVAAGWLLQPRDAGTGVPARRASWTFALLGMAPDLDLFTAAHRGPTHSLGAAVAVGVLAWLVLRARMSNSRRFAVACAAAYGSHVLLDWLGDDTWAPIGIMAAWPVSLAYYRTPWPIFLGISRQLREPALFWAPNIVAVTREILILAPIVLLVVVVRQKLGCGRRD